MTIDELLIELEIDSIEEFEFFEHIAYIIEADDEIPPGTLSQLFGEVDKDMLSDLIEGYFDEMQNNIPDDQIDTYTLMGRIAANLIALLDSSDIDVFVDEFYRFRTWYRFDSSVLCTSMDGEESFETPLSEALTLYRTESFIDKEYRYDFRAVLDYKVAEYIINLDSLAEAAEVAEADEE